MKMTRRYGWRPDKPDMRDSYRKALRRRDALAMPPLVDLRSQMPPVYDQGQLGSCVANAVGAAIEFARRKQQLSDFVPSRLFVYYNARVIEDDPNSDNGVEIRDAIKSVAAQGACPEAEWPYNESKVFVAPPQGCYAAALTDLITTYARVDQSTTAMKGVLAAGWPIIFGISVYDSFEGDAVASSGVVTLPSPSESLVGGHAMLCVGYDDSRQLFIVRNSWGVGWGSSGYCTIPYAYLLNTNLASDFWAIEAVEGK